MPGRLLIALPLILWIAVPSAARLQRDPSCLSQSQTALAGIRLDETETAVVRRLGEPGDRRSHWGEDDGGKYETVTLIYPGLQVDLGRGRLVERLVTTSPATSMPSGVRVGQTIPEVTRRLRLPDDLEELEEVTWSPPVCDDGPLEAVLGSLEVTFTWTPVPGPFDPVRPLAQIRRLSKIEMTYYGP